MDDDLEQLIAVVELLKDADFTQFRYQQGDFLLEVSRGEPLLPATGSPAAPAGGTPTDRAAAATPPPATTAPHAAATTDAGSPGPTPDPAGDQASSASPAAEVDTADATTVEAPMLGTFYRSPKPGEPAFVQAGEEVDADTVVCIVEVMKLMNSVVAGVAGTVVEVCASDGDLVEPGTPLFRVRPAG